MLRARLRLDEGWTTFLLLVLLLLTVVWSVRAAGWIGGLSILQWLALGAMLLGLFLAQQRRVPGVVAHLTALIAGAALVSVMLSSVFATPLIPGGLVAPGSSWTAKVSVMYQQMLVWMRSPTDAEPWLSNWLFLSNLAVLTWLLCYLSTWFVFRRHWVWGAVLPAGAACLLNVYYAPPRLGVYLILFCLCALLLIVRVHIYLRQRAWREAAVSYSLDVDLTFIRDGALMSLLAVVLAWSIPAATTGQKMSDFWARFQEPWHKVQTGWTRVFTALNYQGQSRRVHFGQTLTLGGAVNLGNTPLMEVQAAEPRYWRAVSYDQYSGSGWVNTDEVALTLRPGETQLHPAQYVLQQEFTQTVRVLEPGEDLLFSAGQPLHSSLSSRARLLVVTTGGQQITDVSMLQAVAALRRNQTYTIVSLISRAGVGELIHAGTDYPAWTERYLQLPASLPDRVRRLTREVVQGARTPYEQAVAIQEDLRRVTYDQYISAPPAGRDVVDWFLFENRRGYCDYYATAMVVMCRVLGIPARVAQGYTSGEYLPASRSYRIYQLNAHAWPELFFPGYGWIEFEPTSSQPLPARLEGDLASLALGEAGATATQRREDEDKFGPDETGTDEMGASADLAAQRKAWHTRVRTVLLVLLMAVLGAALLALGWWDYSLHGVQTATRAFLEMRRIGRLMGVPQAPHQTPSEYGESLAGAFEPSQEQVRRLVALYVKQRFSKSGLTEAEVREADALWSGLRTKLLRQALKPRWHRHKSSTPWVSADALWPTSSLR